MTIDHMSPMVLARSVAFCFGLSDDDRTLSFYLKLYALRKAMILS